MEPEVRYHLLRPGQIVAHREACPVVYIPIGTLEWHGVHNPMGADTLQAEGLAILCAQKGGGLVFPPLYFGESRLEALMEANAQDRDLIAGQMGLSPDNFLPERQPFTATEQALNYHKLLIHILAEAESLGFEVGVLVAGHYPLIDHAWAAVLQFNQREYSKRHGMLAWACVDYLPVRDRGCGRPRGWVGDVPSAGAAPRYRGPQPAAPKGRAAHRRRWQDSAPRRDGRVWT